jgi:hypothetical protein
MLEPERDGRGPGGAQLNEVALAEAERLAVYARHEVGLAPAIRPYWYRPEESASDPSNSQWPTMPSVTSAGAVHPFSHSICAAATSLSGSASLAALMSRRSASISACWPSPARNRNGAAFPVVPSRPFSGTLLK